jgi:hypothetical protein
MVKVITIITNFILATLVALSFSSCKSNDNWGTGTKGNGTTTTEARTITENFTGIKVSASIDVILEQADTQSVSVTTDSNLLPIIDTKVENGILVVRPNASYSSTNGVKVTVKMPKIESLQASSSSSITTTNTLTGTKIKLDCSSSADIIATLEVDDIQVEASSSSTVKLSGKALKMTCTASSSSDINAYKLMANDIVAHASSSATVNIHPILSLKAEASSSADINYEGTPKTVDKTKNSSGSIEAK